MENKKEMEIKWKETSCLDGKLLFQIPEEMKEASDGQIKEKFPFKPKPQEVCMNEEGDKIITFNLLESLLEEAQVLSAAREVQRLINHKVPESIKVHARCMKIPAGMLGWFSFITGGLLDDNYHIMFLMPVSGKLMLGTFHFPARMEKQEKEKFFTMVKSIQIITQ